MKYHLHLSLGHVSLMLTLTSIVEYTQVILGVGITQQSRQQVQVPRVAIPIQLPVFVWLKLSQFLGVLAIVIGLMAFTRYNEVPLNPFAAYADMLPGAPISAALEHGFSRLSNNSHSPSDGVIEVCDYSPQSELFSRMRVSTQDGVIKVLILTPHDNTVKLGDLILMWGTPEVHFNTTHVSLVLFLWPAQRASALASTYDQRLIYFLPIQTITFSERELPAEIISVLPQAIVGW